MYSFIFDIGGVLIRYNTQEVIDILSAKTKCAPDKIERLFQHDLLYQVETGRMACNAFYENHILNAMPEISYEDWIQAFMEHYSVNPEGMELLQELKAKGHKVYILSNLAEFHKVAIERSLPEFFHHCEKNFYSYELGFHKPEKEIFEAVCSSIGEKPENCVFFDDMPANVEGANQAGMIGIRFSNECIDEIRERVAGILSNR
ncbi:MAG: HAD family phosphatase [Clostridia bacterium]|nr:HAD family phosphatase [Clostridia bacterium]